MHDLLAKWVVKYMDLEREKGVSTKSKDVMLLQEQYFAMCKIVEQRGCVRTRARRVAKTCTVFGHLALTVCVTLRLNVSIIGVPTAAKLSRLLSWGGAKIGSFIAIYKALN